MEVTRVVRLGLEVAGEEEVVGSHLKWSGGTGDEGCGSIGWATIRDINKGMNIYNIR